MPGCYIPSLVASQVKLAREKESPQPTQMSAVARSDTESEADDGVRARSRSMSERLEHHEV